jgi:hypothetical protein
MRPTRKNPMGVLALLLVVGIGAGAAAEDRMTVWGPPPKEKPHFTKAAEGFPPLPLPVVPQRRTEKKRPPAPPMLIANLSDFGFAGWKGSPGAVDHLLNSAREHLKVWYGWEQLDIREVARKHAAKIDHRTPILYLCAYYPLELTDEQRAALTSYVLGGGTLLINCCGQEAALASAEAELTRMLPKYPLRPLPLDHPIYHSYYDIAQVRYPQPSKNALDEGAEQADRPRLRGITLGTRAAVIVSFEDLASGWNEWTNPGVIRVKAADSTRLGLNLITYVTAENRYARFLSKTRDITGPSVRPREQLVFPQLIHDGNWNPNPSAVPFFLKDLASNTSIAVRFERKAMQIKDPALFDHPLLYMTGSWNPGLGREEVALLRRYLTNGGTLLADAAAGRAEFDVAFRALCAEVFPDAPLQPLPADHPLFTCFYPLDKLTLHHESEATTPVIEAVMVNNRPVILYSKYGLSDGWAHEFSVYARCYETADALKLGTNLIVYVMQ